ncbi:MAG: hypothetical protein OEY43_01420 [Gammaproteobacteria bacterium]|nr:hypothetical protein [Gammaproteobacteria bacterium]
MIHDSTAEAEPQDEHFRVGSLGWRHSGWQQDFYPEDLPEDWQLSYYANEFSTVLVPADELLRPDCDFGQWHDEVPDSFRFYLQWPAQDDMTGLLLAQCGLLGDKLGGLVMQGAVPLDTDIPCYSIDPGVEVSRRIWRPAVRAGSGVAMLSLGQADLRQQKTWLQNFADEPRRAGVNLKALFLADEALSIDTLRGFRQLAELMAL